MQLETIALFGLGLVTGVLGGFLGIGGGIVITLVLLEWFKAQGLPADTRFHLAFGTTLLAIFGTALSSTVAYQRMKRVVWPVVWPMAAAAVVMSLLGSWMAAASSAGVLKSIFAIFCVVNAVFLVGRNAQATESESCPHIGKCLTVGAAAGLVSAYLGVAGGVVMVPLMMLWLHVDSQRAPGTSNAVGIFTCLVGAAGYAWNGAGAAHLPPGSWGFVVPAIALPVMAGTLTGGPLGSLLNRRFGRRAFRYVFAVFLLLVAARIYFKG